MIWFYANYQTSRAITGGGLKATAPRIAILEAVEINSDHPGVEELYQYLAPRFPSLSLSTVYTTLAAFVRTGLVRRLPDMEGRLRVDGVNTPHDHAVCRHCSKVFDVDHDLVGVPVVPGELPGGMEVLDVRIWYDVICAACRKSA